jgi:PAS domain S-box-containing protein
MTGRGQVTSERRASNTPSTAGVDTLAGALRSQRLLTHQANLRWARVGTPLIGLVLVALLWHDGQHVLLLGWLLLLMAAMGLRLGIGRWQRRADPAEANDQTWLQRHRVGYFLQGLVWGLAALLPLPPGEPLHLAILVMMIMGVTAVGFTMTGFDAVAALCLGGPALGLLSMRLFSLDGSHFGMLGLTTLVALLYLGMAARRTSGTMREYVSLRLAETRQAAALRSSESLLERTGAIAGVGGWELDPATMTLRLTGQACRIYRLAPRPQWPLADLMAQYAAEHQAQLRSAFDEAVSQGTAFDLSLPLAPTDDGLRWVRLICQQPGSTAAAHGLSGVVLDTTQAKTAELALDEKRRLLTVLTEASSEGYWFVDLDAITTDANPAMCRILGYPREALIGRSIFEFVDDTNRAIFEREIQRRAEGVPGSYEITLTRADGSQIECSNQATPIYDLRGVRIGAIGLWTDVSERKRAEQQLRSTSEQLRLKSQALQDTLDSIVQGIASFDAQGVLLVHNRRLNELLDLPEHLTVPGYDFHEAISFLEQRGDLLPGGGYVDADGQQHTMPVERRDWPEVYVRRTLGGGLLEVRTRYKADGGMVRTFADVTDHVEAQRALRDSERELRALLDAFPGMIVVTDPAGCYAYANATFAALVGRPRDQIVGRSAREVLGDRRFTRVMDIIARLQPGLPHTAVSVYEDTAFRPRTVLQVTHALGAADAIGGQRVYAFGIDISARKAAEEALIAARDEAQRANQAKSQFLANMSHELRTPLNAILGFGQLLLTDVQAPLAEHQQGQMAEILGGARHLLQLINEVLDLAAVETGRLPVALMAVPLAPLLVDCLGLLRPLAEADGITLVVAEPPPEGAALRADPTRLKQVLLNLLGNAIKYNRRGGEVRIDSRTAGGDLRITISDNGPGLTPEQQARLFDAFERLDAGDGEVEGSGLGLALSRGLVTAMHGRIGVDSQVGAGSQFWIELPLAAASPPRRTPDVPPPALPALPATGDRQKVLYIEDNPINLMLMEALFDRLPGLQLLTADLPEQGLQMAAAERPAMILLDIQLPGIDGFEVLRRLRAEAGTAAIPVVAVSANAMASAIERGRQAGFANYLTKPLDFELLRACITATLAG